MRQRKSMGIFPMEIETNAFGRLNNLTELRVFIVWNNVELSVRRLICFCSSVFAVICRLVFVRESVQCRRAQTRPPVCRECARAGSNWRWTSCTVLWTSQLCCQPIVLWADPILPGGQLYCVLRGERKNQKSGRCCFRTFIIPLRLRRSSFTWWHRLKITEISDLWSVPHRVHMSAVLWSHYTGFRLPIRSASNFVYLCTAFTTEPVLCI